MDIPRGELPILRDDLAVHRTTLANERTMLAYLRTALTFFAAGVTFIKFFETPLIVASGWALVPVSLVTLVRGIISFKSMRKKILDEESAYMRRQHGG